ncbi:helix-turn-helix domain-containing protein, partial [Patescibacteria group bacterium]|nr:helix-turn-helix domain-containing protein [Patescibacteria group bacterium]
MIEQKVLQDIGLSELEAKVYLATLELGNTSVMQIAKKAEVKRPTCYLSLDNLFEKGFVTKIQKKSTTLYSAEKPGILLNKFKEKVDNFKDL